MSKYTVVFAALLTTLLTGCGGSKYGRSPVVTAQQMNCSGNVPAQVTVYSPEEAKLNFEDKAYELNRVQTASGAQWSNSDITFWNKGIDAMVIRKDGSMTTCTFMPKSGL